MQLFCNNLHVIRISKEYPDKKNYANHFHKRKNDKFKLPNITKSGLALTSVFHAWIHIYNDAKDTLF